MVSWKPYEAGIPVALVTFSICARAASMNWRNSSSPAAAGALAGEAPFAQQPLHYRVMPAFNTCPLETHVGE